MSDTDAPEHFGDDDPEDGWDESDSDSDKLRNLERTVAALRGRRRVEPVRTEYRRLDALRRVQEMDDRVAAQASGGRIQRAMSQPISRLRLRLLRETLEDL